MALVVAVFCVDVNAVYHRRDKERHKYGWPDLEVRALATDARAIERVRSDLESSDAVERATEVRIVPIDWSHGEGSELWRAELVAGSDAVESGDAVRVRAVRGLTLEVERA